MISYKGGNGFTQQEAIIILGTRNEPEGVDAEFIGEADKQYDLLKIQLPDGTEEAVWFDITEFYEREDDV